MKINYFNADHTHALIDLPTRYSIEGVIKLFKGTYPSTVETRFNRLEP